MYDPEISTAYGDLPCDRSTSAAEFAEAVRAAIRKHKILRITDVSPNVDLRLFYDELTESLGTCYFLAEDARTNSRTGQKWFEVRFDPTIQNAYRHSRAGQPLHTDGSYIKDSPSITFMYCVQSAPSGGETIFVDADDVVELLREHDPELLAECEEVEIRFAKVGDERTRPIVSRDDKGIILNWNYYCVAPDQGPRVDSLKERFFKFQQEVILPSGAVIPVGLQPGEAVAFQDRRVLHGRNPFDAEEMNARFLWKAFLDPAA